MVPVSLYHSAYQSLALASALLSLASAPLAPAPVSPVPASVPRSPASLPTVPPLAPPPHVSSPAAPVHEATMFTHAEIVTSALSRSSSGLKLPTLHVKDEKNVIAQLHQDNAKERNQATMIITWANGLAETLGYGISGTNGPCCHAASYINMESEARESNAISFVLPQRFTYRSSFLCHLSRGFTSMFDCFHSLMLTDGNDHLTRLRSSNQSHYSTVTQQCIFQIMICFIWRR